jgi:transcriptional regulator of acetoin/glycerol metabolism
MLNRIDATLQRAADDLLSERIPLEVARQHFAQNYLEAALRESKGNITQAARILGVHRNTIHLMLRKAKAGS